MDCARITCFDDWFLALKEVACSNKDTHHWVYPNATFICWEIWKSRCRYSFNNICLSSKEMIIKATKAKLVYGPHKFLNKKKGNGFQTDFIF